MLLMCTTSYTINPFHFGRVFGTSTPRRNTTPGINRSRCNNSIFEAKHYQKINNSKKKKKKNSVRYYYAPMLLVGPSYLTV